MVIRALDNELDIIVLISPIHFFPKSMYILNVVINILLGGGLLTSHYASHRPSQFVVDFMLSNGPNSSLLNMFPILINIFVGVCFSNIFSGFLSTFDYWKLVWCEWVSTLFNALGISSKNCGPKGWCHMFELLFDKNGRTTGYARHVANANG